MANRLQLRRGDGDPGSIFYEGEPIYDKLNEILYVGDDGAGGTGTGSSIASSATYDTVLEMLSSASNTAAGQLKLYEDTDNGTDFVTITAPAALAASYTLTLPPDDGTDGQILKTDGNGVLSFVNLVSIDADSGTADVIGVGETITFAGTALEIETTVTDNQIQIGLPDNVTIAGILTVTSQTDLDGDVNIGDAITDSVTVTGRFDSDLIPILDSTSDLGTTGLRWAEIWADALTVDNVRIGVTANGTIDTDSGDLTLNASTGQVIVGDDLSVTGVSTFTGAIDANGGATIDNIQIGITDDNRIDTSTGDLTLDSAGGQVVVDDNLRVTGVSTFIGISTFQSFVDMNDRLEVDNVRIDGNTVDTTSGDLILDSNNGLVDINDNIDVSGTSTLQGEVTVNTGIVPDADEGAYLGSGAAPFSAAYVREIQIGVGGAGEIDTATGNLTLDSATGETVVDDNLTVQGNLRVVGTAVTFETESVRVEDRLIELGLINNAEPTSATTWDSGIVFNYHNGSAQKAGVIWFDNLYVGIASVISETNPGGGSGSQDPTVTITTYAPIVADSLYLGGINSADLVINSDNEAVNLIFDGGSY